MDSRSLCANADLARRIDPRSIAIAGMSPAVESQASKKLRSPVPRIKGTVCHFGLERPRCACDHCPD
jgi:hypothetical protein